MWSRAVVVAAFVFVVSPTTSAAAAGGGCHPKASRTIMSTPHVRVYSRYETIDHETTWYAWACELRRARPVLLGPRSADPFLIDYVRNLRIAAPYVAFEHFEQDHYGDGAEHVDVVDLRSGRKVHAWSRGFECPSVELVALRLTARGSAAWTEQVDDCTDGVTFGVYRADRRRGGAELDESPGVDPYSLRVVGRSMSWTDGGQARFAPIR
jgi:hypothetical protein